MLPTMSDFLTFLPVIDLIMSEWTKYKFSVSMYFWIYGQSKMALYRPLPGGQKLHFCLAVFHKNFNILSVKSNSTSSWKMEFWECGIADKVLKVIFENTYLWVTFGKSFIFCVFMLTYLFLVLKSSLKRQKSVIMFML